MKKKTNCYYCGSLLTKKICGGVLRLYCEHCNEPIYENPIPATCLVVVDDRERLLLVKRSVEPKLGFWCLPGGFIELGEAPETAALRELEEETGLSGKIDILLGVNSGNSGQYDTILIVGYIVKQYEGILTAGDDALEAAFFKPDDLPEIAFDTHLQFIRIYYSAYASSA